MTAVVLMPESPTSLTWYWTPALLNSRGSSIAALTHSQLGIEFFQCLFGRRFCEPPHGGRLDGQPGVPNIPMVVPDSIKIIPNRSATASGPGNVTRAPPGGPRRMVTRESPSNSRKASRRVGREDRTAQ